MFDPSVACDDTFRVSFHVTALGRSTAKDVKTKVLAEKRAHEIVKLLLEENIPEAVFIDAVSADGCLCDFETYFRWRNAVFE